MIWYYRICAFLSHIIPYKIAVFITRRIADIQYFTFYKERRGVVFENFRTIEKRGLSSRELYKLAIETYENFATFVYEFLILPSIYKKGILKFLVPVNADRMQRPSLVLTAHLGNWEWGASMLNELGFHPTVIALRHPQKDITEFFTRRRVFAGMKVVYLGEGVKEVLSMLREGNVVATLADRDYTGNYTIASFLDRKIGIPRGVFEIAHKLKIPIIPAFCVKEDNRYRVYFEEPIDPICEDDAISKWVDVVERYVKRYPTQWYIFDNIWKE
jgi:KDO2-lipid IV(A) lauroyltransferase